MIVSLIIGVIVSVISNVILSFLAVNMHKEALFWRDWGHRWENRYFAVLEDGEDEDGDSD